MVRAGVIRFSLVVLPPAFWVRAAFAAAVVLGAWTLMLDPGGGQLDSALGSILLLQMFAVSNGFAASASRGHFDPVLVSGRSRGAIAVGAGTAAAIPGAFAWLTILVLAVALGEPIEHVAAPHRQAAFLIVSGIGWAAGVALPPLAAGALWSGVLISLLLSKAFFSGALVLVQRGPSTVQELIGVASICALCPFLLLSDFAAATDLRVNFLSLGLTALAVGLAIVYVSRREYGLTELE